MPKRASGSRSWTNRASVAVSWHQTGMVYQKAGQPEAAEDAYRKSLAIKVRLGNVAGQASTLGQLGSLYDDVLGRPEEAAAFYRQAADKYVEIRDAANEGTREEQSRNALCANSAAWTKRGRKSAGRSNAKRRFGHAAEPWKSWSILADIETDAGNPAAAAEAKGKAIACYLAYRRDGGENHDAAGRISLAVTQSLLAGDPAQAASLLQQLSPDPDGRWLPHLHPRPPSHRRRPPRPHPRRRPGFGPHDGRRNPLPDRNPGKSPGLKQMPSTLAQRK